jgi:hypothetical protein
VIDADPVPVTVTIAVPDQTLALLGYEADTAALTFPP